MIAEQDGGYREKEFVYPAFPRLLQFLGQMQKITPEILESERYKILIDAWSGKIPEDSDTFLKWQIEFGGDNKVARQLYTLSCYGRLNSLEVRRRIVNNPWRKANRSDTHKERAKIDDQINITTKLLDSRLVTDPICFTDLDVILSLL